MDVLVFLAQVDEGLAQFKSLVVSAPLAAVLLYLYVRLWNAYVELQKDSMQFLKDIVKQDGNHHEPGK